MKSFFVICTLILTTSSYAQDYSIKDRYDPTLPFEVNDMEKSEGGLVSSDFEVNAPKHGQLLSWLEANQHGWEPTHDTHAALVIIFQENFRLLLYRNNDFVVVRLIDENGKTHNYKKELVTGECEFLK